MHDEDEETGEQSFRINDGGEDDTNDPEEITDFGLDEEDPDKDR
jgi:hypothetical protein